MGTEANLVGSGLDFPSVLGGYGLRTPFGITLPPGGQVAAFVRSSGAQSQDDPIIAGKLVPTLAAALAYCRAGMGDTVIVLPGHSESVIDATMLTNLVAGTNIIGVGRGSNQPVFRFTTTTAQWVLNKADVMVTGIFFRTEGANGVVLPFSISGADNVFVGNRVQVASGAALKATTVMSLVTGADRARILGNTFYGTATHNVTDGIKIVNALDLVQIEGNRMLFSATAANGLIHVAGAATNLQIINNMMRNSMTNATACVAFDNVASDGICADCYAGQIVSGTSTAEGIVFAGTNCLVSSFQNFSVDEATKSGLLTPVAGT